MQAIPFTIFPESNQCPIQAAHPLTTHADTHTHLPSLQPPINELHVKAARATHASRLTIHVSAAPSPRNRRDHTPSVCEKYPIFVMQAVIELPTTCEKLKRKKFNAMTNKNSITLDEVATTNTSSKGRIWTSRIMSGLVILFMLFDSIFKFIQPAEVVQGTVELGYQAHHIAIIGALGLLSTILYTIPRTAVLGAILLTGYWGGAVATHLRLDNPLFSHILFSVYLGILAWGGLWLRDERVRKIIPFR